MNGLLSRSNLLTATSCAAQLPRRLGGWVFTLLILCLAACSQEQDSVAALVAATPPSAAAPAVAENSPATQAQLAAQLGVPPQYNGELNSLSLINVRDAKLEQVLPPMDYPWAFEFISDNEILLTRISGELLRINLDTKVQTPIGGLPIIGKGFTQIGLLDIELHPDFAHNQRIYFSYAKPHPEADQYHYTEVGTGVLVDNQITQFQTLLNSDNYGWSPSNFGGALEFDDKGYLYITIGDRGEDVLSQRPDHLEGKMLRLNADGSTPEDNPFINQAGFDPRIYVMGIRNAQGLQFDVPSGLMFESEHGPLGGDEINIIKPGANYGWPTISYGNNYATTVPMGIGTHNEGMEQPIFYFLPSIATSAITVYHGGMFPEWDGDILVGALGGEHIAKLDFDGDRVRSSEAILAEVGGRIRNIEVAGDGSIYILSQTTGLHRLYRGNSIYTSSNSSSTSSAEDASVSGNLTSQQPAAPEVHPGKEVYEMICSGCHNAGVSGAPQLGNYKQWEPIMAQPLKVTKEHVFKGFKGMPERGLCYICRDEQLLDMIDYLFAEARKAEPAQ